MRRVRLNESQLRMVIRKIVNEQAMAENPDYYVSPEGEEIDWGDVEEDIIDACMQIGTPPAGERQAMQLVTSKAKSLGYNNLPLEFRRTVAMNLL